MSDSPLSPSPLKKGLFIVLEGIDGTGKTTQSLLLKSRIESRGIPVTCVREPTDGPWGQKIREIALNGRKNITPEQELEYFINDREEDVRDNIQPALDRNEVVITDRYYYSTIAYQSALGLKPEYIRAKNARFPIPDIVIIIEITPETSQIRINRHRGEQSNLGYEQIEFLKKVKKGYDDLKDPNIIRINGDQDVDSVHDNIWKRIKPFIASSTID